MKKDTTPNENLEKKILEEINKTGFPLELRVSEMLGEKHYYVANNLYYIDHDEEKGREIDLRALKNYDLGDKSNKSFVRHCFLIECKKSSDKPWVIFTSPKNDYDKKLAKLDYRGISEDSYWSIEDEAEDIAESNPYLTGHRRGRSYFEPFKNNESSEAIFKALTTSVKATIATRDIGFAAGEDSICFYYPLIVLEGRMFEAYLNEKKITLDEIDSVIVSFSYQSAKYEQNSLAVAIVNEKSLNQFLTKMDDVLDRIGKFFKEYTDVSF